MREKKDNQVGKESMKRRHPIRQQLLAAFLGLCLIVVSIPVSQSGFSVQAEELQRENIENFQLSEEGRGLREGFVTSDNGEGSGKDGEAKSEIIRQEKQMEEGMEELLLFAEGEEELPKTPTEPACGIVSEDVTWETEGTLANGELVVMPGITLTINDQISISGNVTIKGGGTIARGGTQGGVLMSKGSSLTVENVTMDGKAEGITSSVAMITLGGSNNLTLESDSVIRNCKKDSGYGAGIYGANSSQNTVTMNEAVIENCSAYDDNKGSARSSHGGGIKVDESQIILNNSVIRNCLAGYRGGGIAAWKSSIILNNTTISDCSVVSISGGAIHANISSVVLNNATISGCTAPQKGGGIECHGADVTINGGCYENNRADGEGESLTGYAGGGFIHMARGTLTINGGTFTGNSSFMGGCICQSDDEGTHTIIRGGTFLGNTCTNEIYKGSGALYNSAMQQENASMTLSGDAKFGDNLDDSGTDGIYLDAKDQTRRRIQISDTLTYPVKLFLRAEEGYVIAQGVNGYQLTKERDMKKISFVDVSDSGKTWYMALNQADNQIYLSETDPGYKYSVYYDKNGAEGTVETDDTEYDLGADVNVKSAEGLSYEGRRFAGWNTQADGKGITYWPGDSFQIQGDTDLFAIFKKPVTADFYSGSAGNSVTEEAVMDWDAGTGTVTVPELQPMEGFTAAGWSSSPDSFEAEIEAGEEITLAEDEVYYGVYKKEVTLSYDANGGDNCSADVTKILRANVNEEEVSYDIPEFTAGEAAKEGAVFLGWSTAAEGSNVEYQKDESLRLDHDVTLYAIFENRPFFIADFYSGSEINKQTEEAVMDWDAESGTVTAPELRPMEGFTTAGWSKNPDGFEAGIEELIEEGEEITLTEDAVYYGVYEKAVTLSYDANGGDTCPAGETKFLRAKVSEEEVSYDIPVFTTAAAVPRAGYVFVGWNTEQDGSTPHLLAGKELKLDRDTTLYARWVAGDGTLYRIEHYRQDLEGDNYTRADDDTEYLTAKTGTKVTAEAKSYDGYTLNTTSGIGKAEGIVEADGSLALQLYYDRNIYEIEFDLNEGWGTVPEKQTIRYGGLLQTVEEPHRTGYTFKGWYMDQEGTESAFWISDWTVEENTDSQNTVLYAKWADETAPVLGEASFGTGYRNFADWIIGRKKLTITVPVTEDGSGLKQGDYRLESVDGEAKAGSAVIRTQQGVTPEFQARSSGLNAVMTIRGDARRGRSVAEITIEEEFRGSVYLTCTDHAGNPSVEKILTADGAGVVVEDNAPDIHFSKATEKAVNGKATLNVDVTDTAGEQVSGGIAAVSYQIDRGKKETEGKKEFANAIVENYHFAVDIKGEGEHILAVTAVDNAGNESVKEVTVEIKETKVVDMPKPEIPTKTPAKTQVETSVPQKASGEPATGETASVEIFATLGMIAGFAYLMLYFSSGENGITEKEKEEIISRLVRWAQRGRIRKYPALVIIWLFLAYYHSIGKSVNDEWREVCKG